MYKQQQTTKKVATFFALETIANQVICYGPKQPSPASGTQVSDKQVASICWYTNPSNTYKPTYTMQKYTPDNTPSCELSFHNTTQKKTNACQILIPVSPSHSTG